MDFKILRVPGLKSYVLLIQGFTSEEMRRIHEDLCMKLDERHATTAHMTPEQFEALFAEMEKLRAEGARK